MVEDIYSKKYVEISDIVYLALSKVKSFVSHFKLPLTDLTRALAETQGGFYGDKFLLLMKNRNKYQT